MKARTSIILFFVAALAAGCSGSSEGAVIELSAGDSMAYSVNRLEAPAGTEITLRFRHTGSMPITAMGHNVVILRPGTDIPAFAAAAVEAGADAGYIPSGMADQIVAHTRTLGGGESVEIRFTITEPGTYPFICSFPGHYSMMRGDLVVGS